MNQIAEQFAKATLPQKMIVLIMLLAGICVFYWFLFYQPIQESLNKLNKQETELQKKLWENKAIASNLDKFREELAILDEELKQAISLLPNDRDIRTLLRQMSVLGSKSGLDFLYFKPGAETSRGFYSAIPITLRLAGSYNEVAVFFDKVGKLDRIINISDIDFSGAKVESNKVTLNVNCMATTLPINAMPRTSFALIPWWAPCVTGVNPGPSG